VASSACIRPISICWSGFDVPSFNVVRSYRDQLIRAETIDAETSMVRSP
jgi:hypothetical protein